MVFTNTGSTLLGTQISQIVFSITCSSAGSGSSSKVLTFRKANYQSLNTSIAGSDQVGEVLGTLTGKFYGNTSSHTLSTSSNSSFFNALKKYLSTGNSVLVLYNGEVSGSSSGDYSSNYARITSITITVTYVKTTVWYYNGSTWVPCYVYYNNDGIWIQCVPYYNSGGAWIKA